VNCSRRVPDSSIARPRPRVTRLAVATAAVLALTTSAPFGIGCVSVAGAASSARFAVPDWTLRATDGKEVSLHGALAKGPVLVSFWALWCVPCLKELPHLDALARETAGRLTVFAVNEDAPRGVARVRPYLQSKRLGLTVPLDTAGDVARKMQVGGSLPFLVLYDARGAEVYRHLGYHEGDEAKLREKVLALLGDSTAVAAPAP
jgi:thiol-disulfide isomerase/thioredoxin